MVRDQIPTLFHSKHLKMVSRKHEVKYNASISCTSNHLTVPSAPVNVTLKQVGDAEVVLSWEPPLQPNGILDMYEIWYAADVTVGAMEEVYIQERR